MAKRSKPKQLPFGHKLVLNQWIVSLFGFDPLKDHKDGKRSLRPVQPLAKTVKDAPEGMTSENLHHFYKTLDVHLQTGAQITRADLLRYEHNIVSHTLAINEKRDRPSARTSRMLRSSAPCHRRDGDNSSI